MATIFPPADSQGKTTYQVKLQIKGYPTQSKTFPRLTDAKRWAVQTEAASRERRYFKTTESQRHTLAEAIECYLRDVLPHFSSSEIHNRTQQLSYWKQKPGSLKPADVTPALIVEHRDRLAHETTV
jgi:predicted nuclease of restriction endonuclease-like RecB superfamily